MFSREWSIHLTWLLVLCVKFAFAEPESLLVVTVATHETDGFKQFMYSTKKHGLKTEVFGLGQDLVGEDMEYGLGGGQKVNLLKNGLEKYKDNDDLIILFTDSYDVIFLNDAKEIIRKYNSLGSGVVFGAEGLCWPDGNLIDQYPEVAVNEKRFLNSGGYIGKASDIYAIAAHAVIDNYEEDDQLYYAKLFLDPIFKKKWDIKLDKKGELFQPLNGALDDVEIRYMGATNYLYNTVSGSRPSVIHGNGPIKPELNWLANYLNNGWTVTRGRLRCDEDTISLENVKTDDYPQVTVGLFLEKPTPFISEFFDNIGNLEYPKHRMDVIIHNTDDYHTKDVERFLAQHSDSYRSMQVIEADQKTTEAHAKNKAMAECIRKSCKYFLALDSIAQITNHNLLVSMIQQNRSVLAPLLMRPERLWSNFWGALRYDGYYQRSNDYMDIIGYSRVGVWNVPHVSHAILLHASVLPKVTGGYVVKGFDADMSFCKTLRDKGIFIYVTNHENFGHLINNDQFQTSHLHNDLYEIFANPYDWEARYIHEDYYKISKPGAVIPQPCPDVYTIPILKPQFCWELIEEVENLGDWSGGKHEGNQLEGSFKNDPIHIDQIGLNEQWLMILQKYIYPLRQKVFIGDFYDPPLSDNNYLVRSDHGSQSYLPPHHDRSTLSICVYLNRHSVDFEGGGTNFLRYNCSVSGTPQGWVVIHPGKLTHYHEGLQTTNGTRYIMLSFVDL